MRGYPEYKDSGYRWLGQIPSHWETARAKRNFQQVTEKGYSDETLLSVTQNKGVIPRDELEDRVMMPMGETATFKRVTPGDFVISLRSFEGGIEYSTSQGLVSPAYTVIRARNRIDGRYFKYLFKCWPFVQELNKTVTGIRQGKNISYRDFCEIVLPLPPLVEQRKIANFLEHKLTRIDLFIANKQRLIKLLEERKAALINQAVTKGLETDVLMKPSGMKEAGNIPVTWEVRRIRTLVDDIEQGVSPQASSYLADENSWGVLKSGCVNYGVFRDTEHKRLPKDFEIDDSIVVRVGDVIVSRASGSPRLVGSVAMVKKLRYNLILSDKTFRLELREPEMKAFIVFAMNAPYFRRQLERAISGADGLANNLPVSSLKDLHIVYPPSTEEAAQIVRSLNYQLDALDIRIEQAQRIVDLIEEYRAALIAKVVTGNIDVRKHSLAEDASCRAVASSF